VPPRSLPVPAASVTSGRHRRRKARSTVAPAYFTVATIAAFAVSGFNVPSAIGAARSGSKPVAASKDASLRSAQALRKRIATQDAVRISRLQSARSEALQGAAETSRRAKLAAEKARPLWVVPILSYRLTAGFGDTGLWSHAHTGQDFAAPSGTPVRAAGDGEIIFASYDGAYGNKIAIAHPDGTVTWYAHLSAYLRTDGKVQAGDLIGRVGSTGNVTGPHLHFEVRPHDGGPVPPLAWLTQHELKY
jgi:murein DD-endopeptidase MepM/ murein hydrolase activator NlpD